MKLNAFTWIIVTAGSYRLGIYPAAAGGGDDFSIAACAAFVHQAQ